MTGEAERAGLRDWLAVMAAILGAFTAILDIQITNSSLSDIEGALGASSDEGSWISTAYLMAEIIVIPLTGWLASVIGLRRYLVDEHLALRPVLRRLRPVQLAVGDDPVPRRAGVHRRRADSHRHRHRPQPACREASRPPASRSSA